MLPIGYITTVKIITEPWSRIENKIQYIKDYQISSSPVQSGPGIIIIFLHKKHNVLPPELMKKGM